VPIVLVGNKCDIPEREVTKEQGQSLAESFGVPYFESSAKERLNVDESFHELVSMHPKQYRLNKFLAPSTSLQSVLPSCHSDANAA
jgi:GTPase KRas protein